MADAKYTPRLRKDYDERIAKAMTEKFGYKNALEVPKLEKIVINMGVGEATQDKKKVEQAAAEMEKISGQKPVITKAKKSIAQFKLREGMPIGCKVTLRRERMYEFLDRLAAVITRWVSRSRSCSLRSTMTRSTRSGAWTSSSPRPRRRMTKRANCCASSTSPSRPKNRKKPRKRRLENLSHGETEFREQE
jgi:hypothetical protein